MELPHKSTSVDMWNPFKKNLRKKKRENSISIHQENTTLNKMPSNVPRLALLFLSFAFGVISGAVGINSLVKAKQQKSYVKHNAPPGVSVNIDTQDLFSSGVVLTVGAGLLALVSAITLPLLLSSRRPAKHHRISAILHAFFTVWIFATLIPVDVFSRHRSARVTASLGGVPLPASIIAAEQRALGVSPVYWDQHYIRLLAIIPWFAVLFGALTAFSLFSAARTAPAANASSGVGMRTTEGTSGVTNGPNAGANVEEKPQIEAMHSRDLEDNKPLNAANEL